MYSKNKTQKQIWNVLVGPPAEFPMENRAFNYISVVSMVLLACCLAFDLFCHQYIMSFIIIILMATLVFLYYFSRFKKKYRLGIAIYAFCSYSALIINYYVNSGINGPTLFLFFVTISFFVAITRRMFHPLWVTLHIVIVLSLLLSEYLHPEWITGTYSAPETRFLDVGFTYIISIAFLFSVTYYLREYFIRERCLAEERAMAIEEQNRHITEQNRLLEKISEDKNKLFSIISHDLRSPLDSIRGYLEMLNGDMITEEENRMIREELLDETKYTSEMLLNLLYWSKEQLKGINVNLTEIDLKEIIDYIIENKTSRATKKNINLSCHTAPGIKVKGDVEMMRIILRNLVVNAIKFTPDGGDISIKTTRKENHVEISVRDSGVGITPEMRDQIFSSKSNTTTGTNNEKGIGLGLRLCKDLVDCQMGNIWFESKPNEGSVFYISLPLPA